MAYVSPLSHRVRAATLSVLAVGLIGLSVTGCVRLLEPRTSDATYYLLTNADAQVQGPQDTDTTGLAVGLRQPRMASYLDATRMVTRRGTHTIHFSEFHRWAEDLNRGINRSLAFDLMNQSGIRRVEGVPWPQGATFDYVVRLHVLAFEGVGPPPDPTAEADAPSPEGHSRMVVRWELLDAKTDSLLARGLTRHQQDGWQVGDYEALAVHLSESLSILADDIGTRLRALGRR